MRGFIKSLNFLCCLFYEEAAAMIEGFHVGEDRDLNKVTEEHRWRNVRAALSNMNRESH